MVSSILLQDGAGFTACEDQITNPLVKAGVHHLAKKRPVELELRVPSGFWGYVAPHNKAGETLLDTIFTADPKAAAQIQNPTQFSGIIETVVSEAVRLGYGISYRTTTQNAQIATLRL